jgi:hypothetical protein
LWLWHYVEGEQALDLGITRDPTITIDHVHDLVAAAARSHGRFVLGRRHR